jgi:hypothetical protein
MQMPSPIHGVDMRSLTQLQYRPNKQQSACVCSIKILVPAICGEKEHTSNAQQRSAGDSSTA